MSPECPQATRWYSRYQGIIFEQHSYDFLLARVDIIVLVVQFNKQRADEKIPETISSLRSYERPYEGKLVGAVLDRVGQDGVWKTACIKHQEPALPTRV